MFQRIHVQGVGFINFLQVVPVSQRISPLNAKKSFGVLFDWGPADGCS